MLELNQVYHGDCLDVMKDIDGGSIDMILADPPYGTTSCKWDSIIPLEPMWEQLKRVIKKKGAIVLTASQPFTTTLISSNMKMFKYCWVWEKEKGTGFARANKQPLRKHEDVVVFYTKQPLYNSEGTKLSVPYKHTLPINKSNSDNVAGSGYENDGKRIYTTYTHTKKHSILRFSRDNTKNSAHPTQKPVALMEYLIKTYTNEGDTVLDFCAGSGTTGVACKITNRKYILIEQEEKDCEIARQRIQNPNYKLLKTKANTKLGLFPEDKINEWCEIK